MSIFKRIREMSKPSKMDVVYALAVLAGIAVVILIFNKAVVAAETGWFVEPAYVFLGIDYEKNDTYCRDGANEVGHLGFAIPAYSWQSVALVARYTHLSCAIGTDQTYSDDLGWSIYYYPGGR